MAFDFNKLQLAIAAVEQALKVLAQVEEQFEKAKKAHFDAVSGAEAAHKEYQDWAVASVPTLHRGGREL